MTFSMKRVLAIFNKDLKDLSKNMFVSTSILMPLVLAAIYGRMAEDLSIESYYLVINLAFTMTATFIQCAIIAEEKEKNTLRGLMLSPATIPEIFSGKSLVAFLLSIVTIVVSSIFMEYYPENVALVAVAIVVSTLFYIALGTLLGLLARSVVEASVIIMPVVFLLGFGSFIETLMDKYPILHFAEYLPNLQLIEFATKVQAGSGLTDVWSHLSVITAWFLIVSFLTIVIFKKKEIDA
ncbi:ABC transporter permease [Cerasibacillus terrae]|uniref:ABC transporter permease n=1 Tax=Cerasibacillus terrae TaxID=2498845 RepID=A0A5C8NRA0_9BACI|nr:ABC transporter permease [Cerasibacillus terrae]TXL63686.1 ABC transporter permease [Cerasibacillus terrae]